MIVVNSSSKFSSTRSTPASPNDARPHTYGRPNANGRGAQGERFQGVAAAAYTPRR
jgi:hypothetical protein